jgi:hypothetical protein
MKRAELQMEMLGPHVSSNTEPESCAPSSLNAWASGSKHAARPRPG